jgi:preprotein translocase subunit SecG
LVLIYILKGIFVLICIFLVLVILLQSGKGGDVAAAFGGSGSQTAFGPRGAQKPLEKATIVAAILFMVLALLFSLPSFNGQRSVVTDEAPAATPSPTASVAPAAPPAAPAPTPAQ